MSRQMERRPSSMPRNIVTLLFLLISLAHAGDEFLTPTLRTDGAFESADPKYRAVGIEDTTDEHVAEYVRKDNKTYFGVAAKKLYGGWAYGPGE